MAKHRTTQYGKTITLLLMQTSQSGLSIVLEQLKLNYYQVIHPSIFYTRLIQFGRAGGRVGGKAGAASCH